MKNISDSKLAQFKIVLLKQQADLQSRESPSPIEDSSDEVDIAQSLVINDMNERVSMRDKNTLLRIVDAMHRIDDGSFGICEACEESIPEKRLEAMPLCILCVSCAERKEKQDRQFGR